ncbi:MurR/RpiR family transcriptional regulator [Salipiger abyssi]|uniref:MurR/RpiR family transcriptional regulator n=1 Tax=Salipiger abyssi TaxID=1250539 RepID=UPI001A8D1328|nr:MurR/RpiR family transcriptional regulator [Salipiger abyssi]MBN9887057.1 MurR/RpiR family transcriptional regulator [Salipiger abyssi]
MADPDTGPIDLISRLRARQEGMSRQENRVAAYVLDHLDRAVHQNLGEIAAGADVSVATVNRFCQTLGCSGFKEFRIRLAMNVSASMHYLGNPATVATRPDDLIGQIVDGMTAALEQTRSTLDPAALERAAEALAGSERIVFLGVGGGSAVLARDAANRFFRLGKASEAHADGYLARMLAATLEPGHALVALSQSGRPPELTDAVQIARQYGAETIAVTRPATPLAELCDIAITLDPPEAADLFKPTASRVAFMAVIDMLAAATAARTPDVSREKLRRIRTALAPLTPTDKPHPIGD